ncbi:dihydropteroate synthase [Candidatus Scalindua japonica]|uniref:Dihydropteroate synthase n=1 Tax=Candidatus Scalindua japonica TaxID=1284222 RepID=A0A286TUM2_9BACT|nr:dihydropteroate synthase [Candidatus Scalindua japonica]GAX59589.1 dihydropteroate synthase [Candidatus Scalindua japonica]
MIIRYDRGYLDLSKRTHVMGILNITPDSFYDGGKYYNIENALKRARKMIADGVDIIDIGGESTRPNSNYVSADEELRRVIPIIKELSKETRIPISVDTYKAEVADKAIKAGAQIINDISGLQADKEMGRVAAVNNTPIIIMHIKGSPHDFPENPVYDQLITEITLFLEKKIEYSVKSGIARDKIIIDPGIGFGKRVEHNTEILKHFNKFKCLNLPVMIGTSHKSFINKVLMPLEDNDVTINNTRLIGTLVTLVIAVSKGANIVRVHNVKEAVQVIKMYKAIEG